MSNEYRFVGVTRDADRIVINAATAKGTIRHVPLSTEQALTLIRDIAGYLRTQERDK